MIELLSGFSGNVVAIACEGRVTRKDYDDVLVPAVTAALKGHDKVRLYYETTPQFAAIEAGAMWEDFRIGMEHFTRWERIAVVTDVEWIKHAVHAFGFLFPGIVRIFPYGEASAARAWIVAAKV